MLVHRIDSQAGLISSYVHTSPAPGLGRMAALVALETSTSSLTEDQQSEAKVPLHVKGVTASLLLGQMSCMISATMLSLCISAANIA